MAAVDHRRVIADRNRSAILDATERLLTSHVPLTMAAVAAEAGLSRPTLYAHFKTLPEVIEAVVTRTVEHAQAAIKAAKPDEGPADQALMRMAETSWSVLAGLEALTTGAAEHLSAELLHRSHAPVMELTSGVIDRGQLEGVFRTDMPTAWLVSVYYALIHNADGFVRHTQGNRAEILTMLKTNIQDLLASRRRGRTTR